MPEAADAASQSVLGRRRFQLFQRKLHLLQKPRFALRPAAEQRPAKLLDLELEMRDQCIRARAHRLCAGGNRFGFDARSRSARIIGWAAARSDGSDSDCDGTLEGITSASSFKAKTSADRGRTPGFLR